MTTVISRLFENEQAAASVSKQLYFFNFPKRTYRVITAHADEDAAALAARLEHAQIAPETAAAYAKHMTGGQAVMLIKVTYKPLGAAKMAREILAKKKSISVGNVPEDIRVASAPDHAPSVLKDHPHMFMLAEEDEAMINGLLTGGFMKHLTPHRTSRSAIHGGRKMSRMFWPMALLSKGRSARSAMRGGRFMSQMFWPQKLISDKPRRVSVIRGGSLPFSRLFGVRPVSSR